MSEYLADIAAKYQELQTLMMVSAASELSSQVTDEIDSAKDALDDASRQALQRAVAAHGYALNELEVGSDELTECVEDALADPQLISAVEGFASTAEEKEFILNNGGPYLFHYDLDIEGSAEVEVPDGAVDIGPVDLPPIESFHESFKRAVSSQAMEVMSQCHIEDGVLTLNDGYTTVKEAVFGVIAATFSNVPNPKLPFTIRNAGGVTIPGMAISSRVGYSLESFSQALKTNFQTAMVSAEAFKASAVENLTDRLTTLQQGITDKVGELTSGAASVLSNVRNTLSNAATTAKQFGDWYLDWSGLSALSRESDISDDFTPGATDMSQYTGASLSPSLDFHTAQTIGVAVVKTVAAVGAAICLGVYELGRRVFKWAKKLVVENFVDPRDIESLNNGSTSGLVDAMQWQRSGRYTFRAGSVESLNALLATEQVGRGSLLIRTYLGEMGYTIKSAHSTSTARCDVELDYVWKPKCINGAAVARIAANVQTPLEFFGVVGAITPTTPVSSTWPDSFYFGHATIGYTPNTTNYVFGWKGIEAYREYPKFESFLRDLVQAQDLYLDPTKDDEAMVAQGYALATALFQYYSELAGAFQKFVEDSGERYDRYFYPVPVGPQPLADLPSYNSEVARCIFFCGSTDADGKPVFPGASASNLTFVQSCAGYGPLDDPQIDLADDLSFTWYPHIDGSSARFAVADYLGNEQGALASGEVHFNPLPFLGFFFQQQVLKSKDPTGYPFLPYSRNNVLFSDPQFRIKTDRENQEAFTRLLTIGIIIIIVVVVIAVVAHDLKVLKRKSVFKAAALQGRLDSAMWDGAKLSSKEQRKYLRAAKRVAKSKLFDFEAGSDASSRSIKTKLDEVTAMASKIDTVYTNVTGSPSPISSVISAVQSPDSVSGNNGSKVVSPELLAASTLDSSNNFGSLRRALLGQ